MTYNLSKIKSHLENKKIQLESNDLKDYPILHVRSAASANEKTVCLIQNEKQLSEALEHGCKNLIVSKKIKSAAEKSISPLVNTIFVENISGCLIEVLGLFQNKKDWYRSADAASGSSAFISKSAKVGKNTFIGPHCSIGDNVVIEEDCVLISNVVIEAGATVKRNTILHPFVLVGAHCLVGANCEIHGNTTIGSDGYGFVEVDKKWVKIPQVGNVVIENDVEIGSNCSFDRATMDSTIIGQGTKIDNQVHIAHNCIIGKHCAITAGFRVAGSSKIGDYFMCGGDCAVADHISICNGVMLAGRTTVTFNITSPGKYGGHPVQPMQDYLKTVSSLGQLTELRKQFNKLIKKLNIEL